jgi:hypothetical protein
MQTKISSNLIKVTSSRDVSSQMPTTARQRRESRRCVETMDTSRVHAFSQHITDPLPTLSALDSPRPPPGASWLFAQPPSLVHNRHTTTGDTFSTLLGARSGPVQPSVRHNLHEFIGNPRNLPIPKTLPAEATPQPCDIAL